MSKIEQLKELMALLSDDSAPQTSSLPSFVGQYVIVRSRNEGINAGEIEAMDATGIVLKNARRIWYHKPASKSESWYEGVANHGLSSDSKISGAVSQKVIIEDYSITVCSETARQSIESAIPHAQS